MASPNDLSTDAGQPWSAEAARTLLPGLVVIVFSALLLWRDPGFFWYDDFQSYFLPAYCDSARSWAEGEWPLLSPAAGRGAALAGEYQAGVFSVFLTLCALLVFQLGLTLPATAATIFVIHCAVLAMGAFRLARQRGLATDLALLVALVASLNGYLFIWGKCWAGPLVSFAWVPWLWWSLPRAVDERGGPARFLPAGVFLYLILTAGWPFTVLMSALLSGWFVVREWCGRRRLLAAVWPVGAAWLFGLALAAPALLMMQEYFRASSRGQWPLLYFDDNLTVPLLGLVGLVFPALVTPWTVCENLKLHQCLELTGGLVPLVILGAALRVRGRHLLRCWRWEWLLGALLLELLLQPIAFASFRWSFRWLPLFFLVLALLAAHALAELRAATSSDTARPNLGLWSAGLVGLGWAVAELGGGDVTRHTMLMGLCSMGLSLVWALVEGGWLPNVTLRTWLPCLLVPLAAWPMYVNAERFMEVPRWTLEETIRDPAPLEPTRRYWSVYTCPDVVYLDPHRATQGQQGKGSHLYFGLTCLYSGLEFFHGYAAMGPPGLTEIYDFTYHGLVPPESARRLLSYSTGRQGMLALLGVDGLVVANSLQEHCAGLEAAGWEQVAVLPEGTVYHRRGAASPRVRTLAQAERIADRDTALQWLRDPKTPVAPLLLLGQAGPDEPRTLHFAEARVTPVRETRCRVEVEVATREADRETLVVFARQWLPGYRALWNGSPVPVETLNLTMPAVRLPPGATGQLILEYRPQGFVVGCWLAGGALLGALGLLGWTVLRRGWFHVQHVQ